MRVLITSMLLASACGGPTMDAVAQTPTATSQRTAAVPPPASVDDDERHRVTTTSNDVRDAQQAQREARRAPNETPPRWALAPAPRTGAQPTTTPVAPDRR